MATDKSIQISAFEEDDEEEDSIRIDAFEEPSELNMDEIQKTLDSLPKPDEQLGPPTQPTISRPKFEPVEFPTDFSLNPFGVAEAGLTMATGLFGAAEGAIKGAAEAAWEQLTGVDRGTYNEIFDETAEMRTYQPRTETGQQIMAGITEIVQTLDAFVDEKADQYYEYASDPERIDKIRTNLQQLSEDSGAPIEVPTVEEMMHRAVVGATTIKGAAFAIPAALPFFRPIKSRKLAEETVYPSTKGVRPGLQSPHEIALAEQMRSKWPETLPSDTVAAIERGHVQRAEKLASEKGITYGEAINEVVDSTPTPERFEHLRVRTQAPKELLVAPDKRPFREMKASIFEDVPEVTPQGHTVVKKVPLVSDINIVRRDISAMAAPGKFVADLHPVLKWGVDRIETSARNSEIKSKQLLWGTELEQRPLGATIRRKATPTATNEGALTSYSRLDLKDQILVKDHLFVWEAQKVNPTDEMMTAAGFSPSMTFAAKKILDGTNKARHMVNDATIKTGGDKTSLISSVPGFVPHMWTGDFRIFVNNEKGSPIKVLSSNSRGGAKKAADELQKQFPNYSVSVKPLERKKKSSGLQAFRDAQRMVGKDSAAGKIVEDAYIELLKSRGFRVHTKKRKGVGGFMGTEPGLRGVEQFMKGYESYVEGAVRHAENTYMMHDTNRALMDVDLGRTAPNAMTVFDRFRENALGQVGTVDAVLGDWTRSTLGETAIPKAIGTINNVTLTAKLMFGNMRFLAANGVQPFMVIPAKLTDLQGKGYDAGVGKALGQAQKNFFMPDAEAVDAIKFAIKQGTVSPKFLHEGTGGKITSGKAIVQFKQKALETATGQRLAGRVEEYARSMAYLQFYYFMKNSGIAKQKAMEGAAYMTDKYMVEYTTVTRPLMYGQASGAVGKSVGLFKTFQHNYLAQQVEYIKRATGKDKDIKPLAVFTGSQILVAGLGGLIAIEQADNLLDALGQKTLTRLLLESDAPSWLTWGVPSAAMDFDITTTTAAPGVGFGDLFSFPGFDYVGKSAYTGSVWIRKKMAELNESGPGPTPEDEQRFYKAILPTSFGGAIEKYYAKGRMALVTNKKGVKGFDRELSDWVKRFMSGRSLEEAREIKAIWQQSIMERRRSIDIGSLTDAAAWHIMMEEDVPPFEIELAEQLGTTKKEFLQRVKNKYATMVLTSTEIIHKRGKSTAQKRKALQLQDMGLDIGKPKEDQAIQLDEFE